MDFIAIDLDETWKVFQRPQSTYVKSYSPPEKSTNDILKLVNWGSTVTPVDQCTVTDDQYTPPHPAYTFVGGRLGGGSLGSSGIGDGAQTDPTGADDDKEDQEIDHEELQCDVEQYIEKELDTLADLLPIQLGINRIGVELSTAI